ncbi:hypothetical protein C6P45_005306 [Maudiozyma exigua]|uniref:ATPase AAA-type core domain-containing protein n=1 Tax=Maudiozyma exigua TaxID=34358 RepID=A0A9P6WEH0_MAUEX|nr:hypothetical protein C6P45_005306 [Kazachstania exigua]
MTTKRATSTSLKSLLNGRPTKKIKIDKKDKPTTNKSVQKVEVNVIDLEDSTLLSNTEDDDTNSTYLESSAPSSLEISSTVRLNSSRQHIVPEGDNVKTQSMKSFLMSKKPVVKEKTNKPIVISLDDEDNSMGTDMNIHNHVDDVDDDDGIEITNISLQPSKLSSDNNNNNVNVRRTNLKDLFSKFGKPAPEHEVSGYHGPIKRFNNISKLKDLEVPLPKQQLIQPDDEEDSIPKKELVINLPNKLAGVNIGTKDSSFTLSEYETLNEKRSETKDNHAKSKVISYEIGPNRYSQLWSELMKPTSLKNVLLDPKLKDKFSKWIDSSISRLKKPTTRNKLLKTYKEEIDEFKNFIIHDDYEDDDSNVDSGKDDGSIEEFVPLSILHGEGIGKHTLVYTMAKEKGYQIYEINTSQNRGRKDILSTLMEYCTTYYVKDKNESGIVLLSDVDVIFKEHDKWFWNAIEVLLMKSRKPLILTCKDYDFIPTNLIDICIDEESFFDVKKIGLKSVVAYLERYCQTLELKISKDILISIVQKNNKDIRKCLLELQFWFSSGNKINMNVNHTKHEFNKCTTISEINSILDLNSMDDIILTNTWDKSMIQQEDDTTLMTNDIIMKFKEKRDDEEFRLQNDFISDYRIHAQHYNHFPLLPFETNIGSDLKTMLSEYNYLSNEKHYKYPHKYKKMKSSTVLFLETRISKRDMYTSGRMRNTRNSRKIQNILSMFRGNNCTEHSIDEEVQFDIAGTPKRVICEEINPYVKEIAKHEIESREYNNQLYMNAVESAAPENHDAILKGLIDENLTKVLHFSANCDKVVQSWK